MILHVLHDVAVAAIAMLLLMLMFVDVGAAYSNVHCLFFRLLIIFFTQ